MTDDDTSEDRGTWWREFYQEHDVLPWDTGRPQPAVTDLADSNALSDPVLDIGCGAGTEALYLAERGHLVVGVDFAAPAIERARSRASERALEGSVDFTVADVLDLPGYDVGTFETILDVGLLHTFAEAEYGDYCASLSAVTRPGGHVVLVAFGADAPTDWGPNPVSAAAIRSVFTEGWEIETIEATAFETQQGEVPGILAVIRRTSGGHPERVEDRE